MTPSENVKSKMVEMLPMLAEFSKNEEALHAVLMGLYDAGVKDGRDQVDDLLKSITTELSVIVAFHVKKDAEGLKAALDDFMSRRVVVTGDINIKTHSLH